MSENKLTATTPIQLTIKMFLSLLGGMIALFFGFYSLVILPKLNDHDETLKSVNQQLMEINSGIGNINGNIDGINNRFGDLRELKDEHDGKSGGLSGN